jgi:hypothetical protein
MKVVINNDYGGFGLSKKAILRYAELKGIKIYCDDDDKKWCTMYYTVPVAEYKKVYAKDNIERDYKASNELCFSDDDIERGDPTLVKVVEELKEEANGCHASLKIVEVPDDVEWTIEEYDGSEWVAEKHRTWS